MNSIDYKMNPSITSWYTATFKDKGPLITKAIAAQICDTGISCITKWGKKGKITIYRAPDGRELLSFYEIRDIAIDRLK